MNISKRDELFRSRWTRTKIGDLTLWDITIWNVKAAVFKYEGKDKYILRMFFDHPRIVIINETEYKHSKSARDRAEYICRSIYGKAREYYINEH